MSTASPSSGVDRGQQARLPPLALAGVNAILPSLTARGSPTAPLQSYESMSSTASARGHGVHSLSEDMGTSNASINRLPSIRPDGMLIEHSPTTSSSIGTPNDARPIHDTSSEPKNIGSDARRRRPLGSSDIILPILPDGKSWRFLRSQETCRQVV